ncbi:MAG: RluA family pseudouridine synthase [Bacteroidia bacterium]|nr:RluA family pseudouridine synthase [Bacteroidia bacterium]MDW8057453.1 RluA family pseudouridine synthase [Bacteroidia bacterium]
MLPEEEPELYEHYHIVVDAGQSPIRIDKYLAERLTHLSRSRLQLAIEVGLVTVDGAPVRPSTKVRPGQSIQVRLPYPPPIDLVPEPIPLEIVYEDEYLLVVNKPAGMSCHPGAGVYSGTLLNALLHHLRGEPLPASEQNAARPGLVHRIDKDTTGLLVVAKEERTYYGLAQQFFAHTAQRRYWALVWGSPKGEKGTITAHIARDPHERKRYRAFPDGSQGKHAVTHWRVVQRFSLATWIECELETGRTHQIRVHLSHIGHPLVGDKTYGGDRPRIPLLSARLGQEAHRLLQKMPRQALHAYLLGFTHPITGEKLCFEAPMPSDMKEALAFLESLDRILK